MSKMKYSHMNERDCYHECYVCGVHDALKHSISVYDGCDVLFANAEDILCQTCTELKTEQPKMFDWVLTVIDAKIKRIRPKMG